MNSEEKYIELRVKDGRRLRWYAATLKGNPVLHRIRKFGAKLVAQKRMSIQQVIETFPDRTKFTVEEDHHA
jgi:DNA-binding PadR family transcriptional regulator